MSEDLLLRVENVSKQFFRSLQRSLWYGLQELGSEIGGRRHGGAGGSGLWQSSVDVQLRSSTHLVPQPRNPLGTRSDLPRDKRKPSPNGLLSRHRNKDRYPTISLTGSSLLP